ncbi:hypothetical protein GCM10011572_29400 [Pseudoduganella buxea]|nr:hypothetical protein GCM10011572_29400 [Pseudoduganella buxea]
MAPFTASAAPPGTIRVMAIGDSLTNGYPLTPAISYRKKLGESLTAAGISFDYVGGRDENPADPEHDLAHEGNIGAKVESMMGGAAWQQYRPNIILLMGGTNDFREVEASGSFSRIRDVVDIFVLADMIAKINADYQSDGGKVEIFVSSIPPMGYATVDGSSRLTATMLERLRAILGNPAYPVQETSFTATFNRFLSRIGLTPDLHDIFQRADTDGAAGLSEAETEQALKWLGEYIINKYIGDYNNKIRTLAVTHRNVHFVDAGAALTLADFNDGTHPATQAAYDKMAPAWFAALSAFVNSLPRYWVGETGDWADQYNWAFAPDGVGGAGQPVRGDAYLRQHDALDRIVTRSAGASELFMSRLEIDALGSGTMTLRSRQAMSVLLIVAGAAGQGHVDHHAGSTITVPNIVLGSEPGSSGSYRLADAGSLLKSGNVEAGFAGAGSFVQEGGTNDLLRQLILGFATSGTGSYRLEDGTLSANQEFIGLHGKGHFVQNGGVNRVEYKSYTAGNVSGTLSIASEPGGQGTYSMLGGTLEAVRIANFGTFDFRGGTVRAQFQNDGELRLHGSLALTGSLAQAAGGRLYIEDALAGWSTAALHVTETASFAGPIIVNLAAGAAPQLGQAFEILTATAGLDEELPSMVRLPLLPGKLMARAAVAGNALAVRIDTVRCEDVELVRQSVGQAGAFLPADVNRDGIVNVRDVAAIAKKLPTGTVCGR